MIRLYGNNNNVLSINLIDILSKIKNIDEYYWKLIWLEGVSYKIDILTLENEVNKSSDGLLVNSSELLAMSSSFYQLIELILIGNKTIDSLHKLEDDSVMKKNNDFFIELIDSSYWEITSKDNSFIEALEKTFL